MHILVMQVVTRGRCMKLSIWKSSEAYCCGAQVPEVVDFKFNMTLGTSQTAQATGPNRFVESVTFPLFMGGERRSRAQWASPGSLPGSMQLAYDASQLQLLCVAEVCSCCAVSGEH